MIQIILWTPNMSNCWMSDFSKQNQMFQDFVFFLKKNQVYHSLLSFSSPLHYH